MKELAPGLFRWRVIWPDIWSLECYFLQTDEGSVIIDPIEPGIGPINEATDVRAVIISIGWHERSARLFAKRTGAPLFVPERDVCMIEDLDGFETYGDGDVLPGGIRAVGAPGLTRGEQVLYSETNGGTIFAGDCLGTTAKWAPGGMILGGHPNGHPQPRATLSHLKDLDFQNLCPGHGDALIGDGKERLIELFESGESTSKEPPKVSYFPL